MVKEIHTYIHSLSRIEILLEMPGKKEEGKGFYICKQSLNEMKSYFSITVLVEHQVNPLKFDLTPNFLTK